MTDQDGVIGPQPLVGKQKGSAESRGDGSRDNGDTRDSLWSGGGSRGVPDGLRKKAAAGKDIERSGSGGGMPGGDGDGEEDKDKKMDNFEVEGSQGTRPREKFARENKSDDFLRGDNDNALRRALCESIRTNGLMHHTSLEAVHRIVLYWEEGIGSPLMSRPARLVAGELRRQAEMQPYVRDLDRLDSLQSVVETLCSVGWLEEVAGVATELSDERSRIQGETHPAALEALDQLAQISWKLGIPSIAKEHTRKAFFLGRKRLQSLHKLLGKHSLDTKKETSNILSRLQVATEELFRRHKYAGAEHYAREFVDLSSKLMGERHKTTVQARDYLVNVLLKTHDLEKHQEAIALAQKNFGDRRANLKALQEELGVADPEVRIEAESMYQLATRFIGDRTGSYYGGHFLSNIGVVSLRQSDLDVAEAFARHLVGLTRGQWGIRHEYAIRAKETLWSILDRTCSLFESKRSCREEADDLVLEVMTLRTSKLKILQQFRVNGRPGELELEQLDKAFCWMVKHKPWKEATELGRDFLKPAIETMGPEHPKIIAALRFLDDEKNDPGCCNHFWRNWNHFTKEAEMIYCSDELRLKSGCS